MAQNTVDATSPARLTSRWRIIRVVRDGEPIRPETATGLAMLVMALMARHFWLDEGGLANILFTLGVTAAIIALVLAVSRRLLFATLVAGAVVGFVIATSAAKHRAMNMVAHAYDLFFYLGSRSTISYLWSDQRRYVLAFFVALALVAAAAIVAYRVDGSRVPRRAALCALLLSALVAWAGAAAKGERRHMQFYAESLYVSSFFASWGETLETLMRGALLEAAPRRTGGLLAPTSPCTTADKPPHIILIHEESVVQPSLFRGLRYDRRVDPFFRSHDGQLHQMRVETYGGASWLTEFSILAGVSTHSLGGMRQFVQTFTQNKLKETLPQALEACGYRNVVFYPMQRNFVSNERFYSSIGLKQVFDMHAQGAKTAQERDRFYFNNALQEIARHVATSRQPLFTYIQTMSAHWPYNFTYEPEAEVPGGAPGTPPEMHEYLRRLALAKIDFDQLMANLKARFPDETFLVVHYGDHQPTATRSYLGFGDEVEAEDVTLGADSPGFITYYAAHGINYRPRPLPPFETLDVPYLGTAILDMAGLPLPPSHAERKRLMLACKGRYHTCPARDAVLQFHRQLIDSGVVSAR